MAIAQVRESGRYAAVMSLVLASAISSAVSAQQPAPTAPLVFDGVTVVDVEQGKLVPDQRVIITGTHIQTIGERRTVALPPGARVVEAGGKYLIPGLWDLHMHAFGSLEPPVFHYPLLVANGVTGFRNPHSEIPLDTLQRWRQEILAGTLVGPPRQLHGGGALQPSCDPNDHKTSSPALVDMLYVCTDTDAQQMVRRLKAAGADMIKIYDLPPKLYFAAAAEARRLGIPFGGHVVEQVGAARASDSGARIIDHPRAFTNGGLEGVCSGLKGGSVAKCQPMADRFRRNHTWWAPTMIHPIANAKFGAHEGWFPLDFAGPRSGALYLLYLEHIRAFLAGKPLAEHWLWDSAAAGGARAGPAPADTVGALWIARRVGLPIVASTDASGVGGEYEEMNIVPGFSLHAELAIYVAEGLTPLEALQTATLNPAQMLGATDSLGTVAAGKLADLVLLDANPLEDITNTTQIRAVVANGRYYDRAALDGLLKMVFKVCDQICQVED